MIAIAILSNDKTHFEALITKFNRLPVHFHWFQSIDQFFEHQNFSEWQLVWVIGNSHEWVEDILARLNEKQIALPFICSTPFPNKEQRQLFWQLDVKEIIPWPIHRLEMEYFLKAYHKILSDEDKGEPFTFESSLEIINGIDLLRTFTKANCTGILYFHLGERNGRIEFKNGQIIHAIYRQMDPLTSVLILASWKHGFVSFKEDSLVSKRTIMLTNEQIFEECTDYQKEYNKLMAEFPNLKIAYYPHPELNYEDFGPNERRILREMRKGKSINEIVESYEGDTKFILKKLKMWAEQEFILPENRYHQIREQIEEEENKSALKRAMQKLFGKKQINTELSVTETITETSEPALENRFIPTEILNEIKNRLEEMF